MLSPKIVVGALSACKYEERRQACRETWAQSLPDGVELVFLIGDPQAKLPYRDGDVLYCPCPDDYRSLPQKTRWFCLWALATCSFEFLFKCDDDTYVALDRLLAALPEHDYVGYNISGYASGGAGYLLSRKAALAVAARMLNATGAEDLSVQQVLAAADIPFVADGRFHAWNNRCPGPNNSLITAHYCGPRRMRRIHRQMTGEATSRKVVHRLWAKHPHWQGEIVLFDDGVLARPQGDEGEYEFDSQQKLLLRWDSWAEELLLWDQDSQAYRCPDKDFTVREISCSA